jgi:predicted aspartyl protease
MKTSMLMALVAAALQPPGPDAPAPPAPTNLTETLDYEDDDSERMTVPVSLGGHGQYRFIVDTGAERTIVSEELARRLGLQRSGSATLHSTTDVRSVSTVMLPELGIGRRSVTGVHAPTLGQRNLGAEGLIGVDSLQRAQVRFDFVNQQLTIAPASERRRQPWPRDTIVVTAQSRLGRLIVTNASVDGQRVRVIIDTGAQVSIGNQALRRRLAARGLLRDSRRVRVLSVTGGELDADYVETGRIQVGEIKIDKMRIAFAPSPVFERLDLNDRPALLLGMDALQLFEEISIDFARRQVRFMGIREPRGDLPAQEGYAHAGRPVPALR